MCESIDWRGEVTQDVPVVVISTFTDAISNGLGASAKGGAFQRTLDAIGVGGGATRERK